MLFKRKKTHHVSETIHLEKPIIYGCEHTSSLVSSVSTLTMSNYPNPSPWRLWWAHQSLFGQETKTLITYKYKRYISSHEAPFKRTKPLCGSSGTISLGGPVMCRCGYTSTLTLPMRISVMCDYLSSLSRRLWWCHQSHNG